ncbi:MAG TPA: VanZ family protein [Gemmatimonadales bacterium]|nr:VanZ family protein [Gemmatimonadales bacterium]
MTRRIRTAGVVLAAGGLLCIVRATLTSAPDPNGQVQLTPLWCIVCGDAGGADIVANLLLFLPFAIGLRLAGVSWRGTVLVGAALSLTVELLQLVAIPGRDASLSDLLTNTTGGAMGASLAQRLSVLLRPSPAQAGRLLGAWAAVWLATLGASAWLVSPALGSGALESGWAGATRERDIFLGETHEVRLDGQPMPRNGSPPDSAALRRGLTTGRFSLEAQVTSGRPVANRSWIYQLKAGGTNQLTLFQLRRHLGIAIPVRGVELRLHQMTVTLPGGLPDVAGVTVRLDARASDGVVGLRSTYGDSTRAIEFALSPAYGWRLISPFEVGIGHGVRWFTALVLALSLLPLAYWAASANGRVRWILPPVIAAGLTFPSLAAGLPPVHWSEWAAAVAGVAAGWALQRGAAYLQRRCASLSASEFSSS